MNVRILPIATPVSAGCQALLENVLASIHTCRGASLALAMLAACAGLTFDSPAATAVPIFAETFDSGLDDDWIIKHDHFSTADGVLRGNGDGARGAMFRPAAGANELRFSFRRTENGDSRNSGDTVEIAITESDATNIFMAMHGTGPALLFTMDVRQPSVLQSTFGFYVYGDGDSNILSSWSIRELLMDDTWYEGLIQVLPDDTVTFGIKPAGAANYTLSQGHSLPPDFMGSLVGVAAYRVPPAEGATGVALLDNVSAHIVPEPSAAVLGVVALAAVSSASRRIKRRRAPSVAVRASVA